MNILSNVFISDYLLLNLIYFFILFKNKLFLINYIENIYLGIGDWGLGIGPNPQSPIPNPQ